MFAVDGTPADSVYVALHAETRFLPRWPDLVCSGINRGLNLGQDAFYSGTVAAAREGALRGIPAIAASAHVKSDLVEVGELTARLARALYDLTAGALGAGVRPGPSVVRNTPLLNLNVPREWNGKVKKARLGARIYEELIDFRTDPRGREYLWLGGPGVSHERDEGSDTDAYDDGFAALTPLVLDLSSPEPAIADRMIATTLASGSAIG
jgi:5'-nucleotidase